MPHDLKHPKSQDDASLHFLHRRPHDDGFYDPYTASYEHWQSRNSYLTGQHISSRAHVPTWSIIELSPIP